MDFIMRVCNAMFKRLLGPFLLLFLPFSAQAANVFSIQHADITQQGESYLLNAEITYPLTPRIAEALHNGVPITLVQNIEIVQRTPLLWSMVNWDSTIWTHQFRFELRYHDLSEQYILHSSEGNTYRTFPSLDSALNAIGDIEHYLLPREYTANPTQYVLRLKTGIDLKALPSPMRPGALISRAWNVDSVWYEVEWPSP